MKKLVSMILASLMLLSLVACGGGNGGNGGSGAASSGGAGAQPNSSGSAQPAGDGSVKGTGTMLTVYTNSGADGRGEWLQERAAQDGFQIQFIDAGAADTQNRLLAEKNSPIADVVFGLNAIIWESLKAEDILLPYTPVWADEIGRAHV